MNFFTVSLFPRQIGARFSNIVRTKTALPLDYAVYMFLRCGVRKMGPEVFHDCAYRCAKMDCADYATHWVRFSNTDTLFSFCDFHTEHQVWPSCVHYADAGEWVEAIAMNEG